MCVSGYCGVLRGIVWYRGLRHHVTPRPSERRWGSGSGTPWTGRDAGRVRHAYYDTIRQTQSGARDIYAGARVEVRVLASLVTESSGIGHGGALTQEATNSQLSIFFPQPCTIPCTLRTAPPGPGLDNPDPKTPKQQHWNTLGLPLLLRISGDAKGSLPFKGIRLS